MVGRCIPHRNGHFLGDMLVFRGGHVLFFFFVEFCQSYWEGVHIPKFMHISMCMHTVDGRNPAPIWYGKYPVMDEVSYRWCMIYSINSTFKGYSIYVSVIISVLSLVNMLIHLVLALEKAWKPAWKLHSDKIDKHLQVWVLWVCVKKKKYPPGN